jgi:hypothetical protein
LKFAIQKKPTFSPDEIVSFDEVRQEIIAGLQALRARAELNRIPLIYHLDVSPVYPNIVLTNRWQLHAIVTPEQCAGCDLNGLSDCQRTMEWSWRGEVFPASRGEAEMVHRRTVQDKREDMMRTVADGKAHEELVHVNMPCSKDSFWESYWLLCFPRDVKWRLLRRYAVTTQARSRTDLAGLEFGRWLVAPWAEGICVPSLRERMKTKDRRISAIISRTTAGGQRPCGRGEIFSRGAR